MLTEVIMPRINPGMEEGTVVEWKKSEGDVVEKGEVLLEILTDKTNVEVEAPVTGRLQKIMVSANETVPVSTVLAIIDDIDDD